MILCAAIGRGAGPGLEECRKVAHVALQKERPIGYNIQKNGSNSMQYEH